MKTLLYARFSLVILFSAMVVSTTGCYRKKDTIAKIYVVDQNNQRVPGAIVTLIPESTQAPYNQQLVADRISSTNRSGEAIFIYNDVFKSGQAGVAVMKIKVEYAGTEQESIIKIDQETTSEKTVVI